MQKYFDGIKDFGKAKWWDGASWLFVLIALLLLVVAAYLGAHRQPHVGYEYLSLNADQQKAFNDVVGVYTDGEKPTSMLGKQIEQASSDTERDRKSVV